jgi:hypothetical protein
VKPTVAKPDFCCKVMLETDEIMIPFVSFRRGLASVNEDFCEETIEDNLNAHWCPEKVRIKWTLKKQMDRIEDKIILSCNIVE